MSTAPTVRSVSAGSAASGSALSLNLPSGVADGDILIACVAHQGGNSRNMGPSMGSWTLLSDLEEPTANSNRTHVWWKVYNSTENNPASFTVVGGSDQKKAGGIICISGADLPSSVDTDNEQNNASGTAVVCPSITTTVDNTLLVAFGTSSGNLTFTPPGGYNEQWDVTSGGGGSDICCSCATSTKASAGSTGTVQFTLSASDESIGVHIAIKPESFKGGPVNWTKG